MASTHSIPTRPSLLARLKSGDDVEGWQEFYCVYGGLLRAFARKCGLNETEAEEVVQDTAIGVARGLPGFRYDPARCSFKTWMLNLAQWRITDALRRRRPESRRVESDQPRLPPLPHRLETDPTSGTSLLDRIPDPRPPNFGADWDAAWEQTLRNAALDQVRRTIDPRHFQVFDLYVLKGRPVREVVARVGVAAAQVYLIKHRVASRLRREMRRLERQGAPARLG